MEEGPKWRVLPISPKNWTHCFLKIVSSHSHELARGDGSRAKQPSVAKLQEEQEQVAEHKTRGTVIKSEDLEGSSSGQEDRSDPAHSHVQARGAESLAKQPSFSEPGSLAKQLSAAELQEEQEQAAKHEARETGIKAEDFI